MDRRKPGEGVQDTSIGECRAKDTRPSNPVDNWAEHPLFMTSVPSPEAFRRNPLLSALAATIDETEQCPFGPQRRRQNSQGTCARASARRVGPSRGGPLARRRNIPTGPYSLRKGVPSRESSNQEIAPSCDSKDETGSQVPEADSEPLTANSDNAGPSMGELHICMHMWSIGNK